MVCPANYALVNNEHWYQIHFSEDMDRHEKLSSENLLFWYGLWPKNNFYICNWFNFKQLCICLLDFTSCLTKPKMFIIVSCKKIFVNPDIEYKHVLDSLDSSSMDDD